MSQQIVDRIKEIDPNFNWLRELRVQWNIHQLNKPRLDYMNGVVTKYMNMYSGISAMRQADIEETIQMEGDPSEDYIEFRCGDEESMDTLLGLLDYDYPMSIYEQDGFRVRINSSMSRDVWQEVLVLTDKYINPLTVYGFRKKCTSQCYMAKYYDILGLPDKTHRTNVEIVDFIKSFNEDYKGEEAMEYAAKCSHARAILLRSSIGRALMENVHDIVSCHALSERRTIAIAQGSKCMDAVMTFLRRSGARGYAIETDEKRKLIFIHLCNGNEYSDILMSIVMSVVRCCYID